MERLQRLAARVWFSSFPFNQETSVHQLPFLHLIFLSLLFPTSRETAARRLLLSSL